MAIITTSSSVALLNTLQSSTDLYNTCHPSTITISSRPLHSLSKPPNNIQLLNNEVSDIPRSRKWRTRVSFFPLFLTKARDSESLKEELLEAIASLDRGAEATPEDQERVDQRSRFLRPNGKIYQAINVDTLRAQNLETWPFFNQVTANLVPLNARRVAVKFDFFRIAGLIPIKSPGSGRGQLEITYLDDELRLSRGQKGNLFILKMVDPSYRVPL